MQTLKQTPPTLSGALGRRWGVVGGGEDHVRDEAAPMSDGDDFLLGDQLVAGVEHRPQAALTITFYLTNEGGGRTLLGHCAPTINHR